MSANAKKSSVARMKSFTGAACCFISKPFNPSSPPQPSASPHPGTARRSPPDEPHPCHSSSWSMPAGGRSSRTTPSWTSIAPHRTTPRKRFWLQFHLRAQHCQRSLAGRASQLVLLSFTIPKNSPFRFLSTGCAGCRRAHHQPAHRSPAAHQGGEEAARIQRILRPLQHPLPAHPPVRFHRKEKPAASRRGMNRGEQHLRLHSSRRAGCASLRQRS